MPLQSLSKKILSKFIAKKLKTLKNSAEIIGEWAEIDNCRKLHLKVLET